MNNGSFAKYTTAYINRPSKFQLVDIKMRSYYIFDDIFGANFECKTSINLSLESNSNQVFVSLFMHISYH